MRNRKEISLLIVTALISYLLGPLSWWVFIGAAGVFVLEDVVAWLWGLE